MVDQSQLSIAIGKGGQNVRLASKLTGYEIDIESATATVAEPEVAKEADQVAPAVEAEDSKPAEAASEPVNTPSADKTYQTKNAATISKPVCWAPSRNTANKRT